MAHLKLPIWEDALSLVENGAPFSGLNTLTWKVFIVWGPVLPDVTGPSIILVHLCLGISPACLLLGHLVPW